MKTTSKSFTFMHAIELNDDTYTLIQELLLREEGVFVELKDIHVYGVSDNKCTGCEVYYYLNATKKVQNSNH